MKNKSHKTLLLCLPLAIPKNGNGKMAHSSEWQELLCQAWALCSMCVCWPSNSSANSGSRRGRKEIFALALEEEVGEKSKSFPEPSLPLWVLTRTPSVFFFQHQFAPAE